MTPQLLSVYFRYVRNLCLIERRLTPDLYSLVVAAQQTAGDDLAIAVGEAAREYPYRRRQASSTPTGRSSGWASARPKCPGLGHVEDGQPPARPGARMANLRAADPAPGARQEGSGSSGGTRSGCAPGRPRTTGSRASSATSATRPSAILGADLARSEKFTSSVMDGLDIRETLRNWHTGDLYVKVLPPSRGTIEIVVFLFDTPADPQIYTNRATWYAEHLEESTLAFYGTDAMKNLVGPGIAQAEYGGAMFLFPPRPIPDVWEDSRLDFADTLEERLLAAAFLHSREKARRRGQPPAPFGLLATARPQVRQEDRPPARSAGSAASSSSGSVGSTSSTASRSVPTPPTSSGTSDNLSESPSTPRPSGSCSNSTPSGWLKDRRGQQWPITGPSSHRRLRRLDRHRRGRYTMLPGQAIRPSIWPTSRSNRAHEPDPPIRPARLALQCTVELSSPIVARPEHVGRDARKEARRQPDFQSGTHRPKVLLAGLEALELTDWSFRYDSTVKVRDLDQAGQSILRASGARPGDAPAMPRSAEKGSDSGDMPCPSSIG